MASVRLLPFADLDGPANMAADEVLLWQAAESGRAAMRFYTWKEPTLSLGYFQPAAEHARNPRLAALPWVRRATGGSALVHHHELTYALALPAGTPWQSREPSWLCRMHEMIALALSRLGAVTQAVACGRERRLGPILCFLHQTPGDLLASGHKVVGSAQRKQRGALLQHGGILLATSELTPELPGLRELTGFQHSPQTVARAISDTFSQMTGWTLTPEDWTETEQTQRRQRETERYRNPAWNEKR